MTRTPRTAGQPTSWGGPAADEHASCTQAVEETTKKRILFVDDDRDILDGLRAVLRQQRREWDVVFALGGPAALEEVNGSAFDVIVTDMRMPVVDGAELLRQVKALQPRAVRIVLSGQTDSETAMKTVFTAHQFLSKPCDVDELRAVVRRACALNDIISTEELRALAGDVSQLPAAPGTYTALTSALTNPACSIAELASIVERDSALCAKVLQVVNSAFFGLPRQVSNVRQATSYLGTLTLRNLALAMEAVAASKAAGSALRREDMRAFQVNALFVGLLGRHWYVGDHRRADDAFVAGMLRDMGHLMLAARGTLDAASEEQHPQLSAYLLGLWGIPHGVLEPVAFHEHPERLEHDGVDVVDVVNLADRVAADLAPSPFQLKRVVLDEARLDRLGVDAARREQLRRDASQLLVHTRSLLS
jgi:HD-like signal output (HDOD) protein